MTTASRQRTDLARVVTVFREHLWLPDPGLVYLVLGAVAANRLPGNPCWLLVVGPPSSGKSEVITALRHLPEYQAVSTFTEASLLSAAPDGTPGLLTLIGDFGLLAFSDLTTMLAKHKADRDGVLGCLREVYDCCFVRRVGNKGGKKEWQGKVGLVAGVTEMIDDYDLGQLGERFIRYRLPELTTDDVERTTALVLEDVHGQPQHKERRAQVVAELFERLKLPAIPPPLNSDDAHRLSTLAGLGARCRSPVIRDTFKGDTILRVPEPEGVGRLLAQLAQTVAGMRAVGVPELDVWRLAAKVALDGMHPLRRKVLDVLRASTNPLPSNEVASRCNLPGTSVRRYLEDLAAHELVVMTWHAPAEWDVSEWTLAQWWAVTPAS